MLRLSRMLHEIPSMLHELPPTLHELASTLFSSLLHKRQSMSHVSSYATVLILGLFLHRYAVSLMWYALEGTVISSLAEVVHAICRRTPGRRA